MMNRELRKPTKEAGGMTLHLQMVSTAELLEISLFYMGHNVHWTKA
jgi:hypothetical protein